MSGYDDADLGHLPATVRPRDVMNDHHVITRQDAGSYRHPRAPHQLLRPGHRTCAKLEGVEVDIAEPQHRMTELIATRARILSDEAVGRQRLDDAVDGGRRQFEPARKFGDPQPSLPLKREENPNCPVDGLDQANSFTDIRMGLDQIEA